MDAENEFGVARNPGNTLLYPPPTYHGIPQDLWPHLAGSEAACPTYQIANGTTTIERPQAAWGTYLPGGALCSGRLKI